MHIVNYGSAHGRTLSKPRRTRRIGQWRLECEALEDRRLLSGGATTTPSITFTFNFNVNQFANSIPNIVTFSVTFATGSASANASAASNAAINTANTASASVAAQTAAAKPVSITPISPSVFSPSATNDGEEPVVFLVFTPQNVVHLGASSAAATTQRAHAVSVEQDTTTTSGNAFGQSLFDTVSGMADPTLVPATVVAPAPPESSLIDLIEPLEPLVPAVEPKQPVNQGAPAPANDAAPKPAVVPPELLKAPAPDARASILPGFELDAALELMSSPPEFGPTPQDQAIATASDSTPRFVGAAIAVGGYQLLFGRAERFRDGRFRTGSKRRLTEDLRFQPSMN
jgi:hypothetical protein